MNVKSNALTRRSSVKTEKIQTLNTLMSEFGTENDSMVFEKKNGHEKSINCLCIDSKGAYIYSGSSDKILKCWNSDTGVVVKTFKGHLDAILCCALTFDDLILISGSKVILITFLKNNFFHYFFFC